MQHDSPGPRASRPHAARRFSLADRRASFTYAMRGIRAVLRTQHNAWIHAAASALVILAGVLSRIAPGEWLAIVLATGLVWTAEAVNTAIEALCDALAPERDPRIELVKDAAAGAVLLAAIAATAVAAIVFGPRLLTLLGAA